MHGVGGHFSVFIAETFHFLKTKLLTIIQKFRKSVKIKSIMKFEAILFEVMWAVTINCKLTWPGLNYYGQIKLARAPLGW